MRYEFPPIYTQQYLSLVQRLQKTPEGVQFKGVYFNNYLLVGTPEDLQAGPVAMYAYAGLRPVLINGAIREQYLLLDTTEQPLEEQVAHATELRNRIRGLDIPDRVKKIQPKYSGTQFKKDLFTLSRRGLVPHIWIMFGETTQGDKRDIVAIYHPTSTSTEDALSRIKSHVPPR